MPKVKWKLRAMPTKKESKKEQVKGGRSSTRDANKNEQAVHDFSPYAFDSDSNKRDNDNGSATWWKKIQEIPHSSVCYQMVQESYRKLLTMILTTTRVNKIQCRIKGLLRQTTCKFRSDALVECEGLRHISGIMSRDNLSSVLSDKRRDVVSSLPLLFLL